MLKKSVLLAAALVALALPSMASGASWGIVGTTHVLDSSNVAFNAPALGLGVSCAASQFHVDVTSAALVTITNATLDGCQGTGAAGAGCLVTVRPTRLPWSLTVPANGNIQMHGAHFDVKFHHVCPATGLEMTVIGTISLGVWDAAAHQITYSNASGFTGTAPGVDTAVTFTGTLRDTTQTLTVT